MLKKKSADKNNLDEVCQLFIQKFPELKQLINADEELQGEND